jgi:hypothetical protein
MKGKLNMGDGSGSDEWLEVVPWEDDAKVCESDDECDERR